VDQATEGSAAQYHLEIPGCVSPCSPPKLMMDHNAFCAKQGSTGNAIVVVGKRKLRSREDCLGWASSHRRRRPRGLTAMLSWRPASHQSKQPSPRGIEVRPLGNWRESSVPGTPLKASRALFAGVQWDKATGRS
jgi:hypothetical protein